MELSEGRDERPYLVVGGEVKQDRLAILTAAACGRQVEWIDARAPRAMRPIVRRIASGRFAGVVLLTLFVGHNTGDAARDACKSSGTPIAFSVSCGAASIAGALAYLVARGAR